MGPVNMMALMSTKETASATSSRDAAQGPEESIENTQETIKRSIRLRAQIR